VTGGIFPLIASKWKGINATRGMSPHCVDMARIQRRERETPSPHVSQVMVVVVLDGRKMWEDGKRVWCVSEHTPSDLHLVSRASSERGMVPLIASK